MSRLQRLALVGSGALVGNGLIIDHWTHVVWFDPIALILGAAMVALYWRNPK